MALRGHLDSADRGAVRGWAVDDAVPDVPVSLVVRAGGIVLGRVLANAYRPDLRDAKIAEGRCAFEFDLSGLLSPLEDHLLAVQSELDDEHLQGSPTQVARSGAFDDVKNAFANIVAAYDTNEDFVARLKFLAEQTEALLSSADARRAGHAEHETRRRRQWLQPHAFERTNSSLRDRRQALIIDARTPHLTRDAGSRAIVSHIQSLQRLGFAVSFVPMDLGPASPDLVHLGVDALTRPWYASVEEVLVRNAASYSAVYLHRADVASVYGALVRKHQPRARIIYSVADLGSLRLERQAIALEFNDLLSASRNERTKEQVATFFADAVVTHSTVEAAILRERHPDRLVQVIPFAVPAVAVERLFAERRGVAFIGSFDHQPNLDAAFRLIEDIMPEVSRLDPTITCLIAGSGMPHHLAAKAGGAVRILGHVPDITSVYDMVRLTCAPLAYGAGIKGKVLESLAAGLPCACTTIAAEGLNLPPELKTLIADEPTNIAALICRLHEDEDLNRSLVAAGHSFVETYAADGVIDEAMLVALGAM